MLNVAEIIGSLEMQRYGTQYPAVPCIILEKKALKVTSLFLRRKPQEENLRRFCHQVGFPLKFTKLPIH